MSSSPTAVGASPLGDRTRRDDTFNTNAGTGFAVMALKACATP